MKLPNAITSRFGRQLLQLQKVSPQIMFAGGIVGVVTTAVLTARSTLKLSNVFDKSYDLREHADSLLENEDKPEYDEKAHAKDLTAIKVRTALDIAKLYALPFAVGTISIAALTGSHVTLNRRNTSLMAAYAALDEAFDRYRERVRKELGEDQDRNFRHGVERTEEIVKGKGGTDKLVVHERVPPDMPSLYARFFDELCPNFKRNAEINMIFLRAQQAYMNDLLKARGHVFLNEVYDALGIPRTGAGAIVGWVYGNGDDFIDFGIFDDKTNDRVRDFVNGREDAILLDFNVDGVVYDKI